ncbi:MAG TPA: LLM class flavin-dependent oxidoreductase [Acidimicrobiales bacterium]|nr:LLM class flavin-dependent oxidoreductase [Acidimicrobiales bacterium]
MRFGIVLPGGPPDVQLELAVAADRAGWDGVFVWEAPYGVDAWCLLSAMAMRTENVRLGTMLTPLPWRRPWKVASQVATLDQLSGGRAVIGIGLGAVDTGLGRTGEVEDRRHRAELLDDAIGILGALWSGVFSYRGLHHTIDLSARADLATFRPVQSPPPIWVVGRYPSSKSMARVLRCQGWIAEMEEPDSATLGAGAAWLREHRAADDPGIEVICEGETPADDPVAAADTVERWAAAGATWWLESRWGGETPRVDDARLRIAAGPPCRDRAS